MTYKLLFVCLGNICRSPSAENIMNHLLEEANLSEKIVCDSAGTSGYHIGAEPDRRMNAAANKRGLELTGRSRKLKPADLQSFDLILAMDGENYQDILYLDREGKYEHKVRMMCDFATQKSDARSFAPDGGAVRQSVGGGNPLKGTAEPSRGSHREVPDPYYGGDDGFDYVIELLFDACSGLLEYVVNSEEYRAKT